MKLNLLKTACMGCISALLIVAGGCSQDNEVQRFPVRGQIVLNNQPLAEAHVVFHPVGSANDLPQPVAETDAEGKFVLTTLQTGDGAAAGQYAITVEQRALIPIGEEMVRDGANQLPARYAQQEQSGLTYTVVAGDNDVPTLMLKTP